MVYWPHGIYANQYLWMTHRQIKNKLYYFHGEVFVVTIWFFKCEIYTT